MLTSIIGITLTLPVLMQLLVIAVALGLLTALVFTFRSQHSASFALTLTLLPMIVSVIILLVNGNIGTGVAVAGAFTLVRFRSVPGTAREIAAIFTEMALGLALGMGYVGVALILFALTAAVTLALTLLRFGAPSRKTRQMKITLPENADYETIFDDVFALYHVRAELQRIHTTNMGTLFELTYLLTFPTPQVPKAFIDELRIRNSNLNITIGAVSEHDAL